MIMHKPALFLLSLVITVLLMALTLGVAAASSHVISDQYIDVEPDGYWTAEVAAGGHQQWNFDLVEQRNHNTVIEIVEPADASLDVSIDGQHLGTVSVTGHFTVSLEAGSHAVTIDNPGDVPVQYEFYMGNGFDFGDAPDSYSTLLGSGGPSHVLGSSVFMGPSVDPEPDGQPSVLADGGDLDTFFTSSGDDEDGVAVISPLTPGFLALMAVVGSPSGGKLDAWIDYDGSGVFDDPAERITPPLGLVLLPGGNPLTFTVPAGALPGATFARFRISTVGGLLPGGPALDGEVEDHRVFIEVGPQQGHILIDKVTIPGGHSQLFTFTPSYGGDFQLDDDDPVNDSGVLSPGSDYVVTEAVPAGWDLTSATCADGSPVTNIDLSPGETVTCTFTNTQRGTIVVEKQTNPDGASGSFTFNGNAAGTISDDGTITVADLVPGQYTSTETVPPGWRLTSIVCDDNNSSGDILSGTVTFNVDPGEIVTCVFTNRASVGGVTSFERGSGSSVGIVLLAGGVTLIVAIVATSAWYTRRRWLGSRS